MILMIFSLNQTRSRQSYAIKTAGEEPLYLSTRNAFVLGFICTSNSRAVDTRGRHGGPLRHPAKMEGMLTTYPNLSNAVPV